MPKYQRSYASEQIKVLERELGVSREMEKKTHCPECSNQIFFLEAGFLCPTCGYSMETVYN
ncbi:hypothetical protein GF389_03835 [Candidatus Dojkabacteria bacterium]|nr:hypothetical protein [Candidatus Dojkabacteria bacterium]